MELGPHSGAQESPAKANLAALPLSQQDFGLDVPAFRTLVGNDCPLPFLLLAIHCCSVSVTPSLTPTCELSSKSGEIREGTLSL